MSVDYRKAPFPWFGGKSKAAPAVWGLLDAMHDGDSRPGALGSAVLHLRMALNAEDGAS